MGNESSVPVDDSVPPTTLKERTVEAVAEYIKEQNVRRIVVMVSIHRFNIHLSENLLDRCRH